MAKPIDVTDQDFEAEVIDSELPVLVDFWADWCGPCKIIAPRLDELADEYDGRVKFVKIDVDACPTIALNYGIRSIPTLIIFKDGKEADRKAGAAPKSVLKQFLDSALP